MTRHDIGAFLFGVGVAGLLFTCWAVASVVWGWARDAVGDWLHERRVRRAEAEWRAKWAAMSDAEKAAGAERLRLAITFGDNDEPADLTSRTARPVSSDSASLAADIARLEAEMGIGDQP